MSKIPCPHLEKLLPKMGKSLKAVSVNNIDRFTSPLDMGSYDPDDFRTFLGQFDLTQLQMALLTDRFVYNKTLEELVEDYRFSSTGQARNHLNLTLMYLEAQYES